MKTVVLFGAGQFGAMISRLIGTDYTISCFADNFEAKWGTILAGIPVVSPEESLLSKPDCFCLCVMDSERSTQMETQIRKLGFDGPILRPDLLKTFDSRVATMRLLAEQLHQEEIPGDVAELGVFRGDFAALINAAFPDRSIHLFDTFKGFPAEDVEIEQRQGLSRARIGDFAETAEDLVEQRLLYRDKAVFHKGYFPETFRDCTDTVFAFVSIDADLYAPTAAALPLFWERLSPGGVLLIHDVNGTQYTGAGKAVREFCREQGLLPMPVCDLHGSVVLRKPWKKVP
ncbi:MAG: class I SAM-dependent methyltransferase [Oscillospiraceae bacterium]|nr:class I SAM-dependent methyltransferase [Oscillospiraceae bacterium]